MGVDVEALRVGPGLYTPGDVVEASDDGGRELREEEEEEVMVRNSFLNPRLI